MAFPLSDEKIEQIVAWRMGRAYSQPILDWRSRSLNFDSSVALLMAKAGGFVADGDGLHISALPGREGHKPEDVKRIASLHEDLAALLPDVMKPFAVFAAMEDARLFPSLETLNPSDGFLCVQLSHNRPVDPFWRRETEIILWPHFARLRWWKLSADPVLPWGQRKPGLFWRGQTTGSSFRLAETAKPILTGIRHIPPWLEYWLRVGARGKHDEFDTLWKSYARLVAVVAAAAIPDTDIKLTSAENMDPEPINFMAQRLGQRYTSERIQPKDYRQELFNRKHRLAIEGNDCASSFREDMLSGSLLLMPEPFWENEWQFGLQKNVHYLPLRADFADLEAKLEWCRENDSACEQMAAAARAHALTYFDPALEHEVQIRILRRLADQTVRD